MFNKIVSVILTVAIALTITACGGAAEEPASITTITSTIELAVGEDKQMHFTATGTSSEVVIVSSDETVCQITHESTTPTTAHYTVTALTPGIATFHAESKDGTVKSEEVTVRINGLIATAEEGDCPAEQFAQNYTIEQAQNDSQGRRELRVTVPPEIEAQASDGDITRFLEWLADRQDEAFDFPKLYIYLFNSDDDWSGGYIIAMCHYTPESGEYEISIHDPVTREALRQ